MKIDYKSSLIERNRTLVLSEERISIQSDEKILNAINVENLQAFRFGVKWIYGYQFAIGRVYCIELLASDGNIITIKLKSLYRVRSKILGEKYSIIINALFDKYFNDIFNSYLEIIRNNKTLEICGSNIYAEGIKLFENDTLLVWNSIEIAKMTRYCSITSMVKKNKYRIYNYLEDWNAYLLMLVVDYYKNKSQ